MNWREHILSDSQILRGKPSRAFEKIDFVPKSEKILQATNNLQQGETSTLRFHAPEPGRYPYSCSFPGHYLVMRGTMIVEPKK